MHTLDDLLANDIAGQRVLLRADLNVPIHNGVITDDGRIRASLPTINRLRKANAKVIVVAHLGRPDGVVKPELSLAPVAVRLSELLDAPVALRDLSDARAAGVADADIILLENIRFDQRETSKDDALRGELADELAQLAEAFVSDGFGVVHRKQASVYDIALRLPHYSGDLINQELAVLNTLSAIGTGSGADPKGRPYVVVLGGAKVSDKLGVIANLLHRVDCLLIGGGMAYTFLKAQGHEVGKSLLQDDQLDRVSGFIAEADRLGVELILPVDVLAAKDYDPNTKFDVVSVNDIPENRQGLDIGPATQQLFSAKIAEAATIFWNGPVGVFEFPAFSSGTRAVAEAIAESRAFSVIGGGDSAAAIRTLGIDQARFSHISTGGGASLEYLEGKQLPGIAVLDQSQPGEKAEGN